jgi:hypothetical protein
MGSVTVDRSSRVAWLSLACAAALGAGLAANAAEPTPPRAGLVQPRSGQARPFGSGSITTRSDGSSSRSQPFGSGRLQHDTPARR